MLFPSIFTFRVGPVLLVDILSHFLMIVWEKKIEVLVSEYTVYAKLICENVAQTYYVIGLFLSHMSTCIVAQQKIFRTDDHRSRSVRSVEYHNSNASSQLRSSSSITITDIFIPLIRSRPQSTNIHTLFQCIPNHNTHLDQDSP